MTNASRQVIEEGWNALNQGDIAKAESLAYRAISGPSPSADAQFLLAVVHHVRGDMPRAMAAYAAVLEFDESHVGAINNLGVLHVSRGEHAQAAAVLERLVERHPEDPIAQHNYANALAGLGKLDRAIEGYRRALAVDPNYVQALTNLGAMLIRRQRFAEALPLLEKAASLAPAAVEVRNNLGLALLSLGRLDEAESHLRFSLEQSPDNFETLTNLGVLAMRRGDFPDGLAHYERACRIQPHSAEAQNNVGFALLELGRSEEALQRFQLAIECDPRHVPASSNLGKALGDRCRFAEAVPHLERAIAIDPTFTEAHNLLGMMLFHLGDDAAAEREFLEALRLDPSHAKARLNLSFLRLRQGNFARGWPDYETRPKPGPHDGRCPAPYWTGGDLTGRTVLVRAEQGLGDSLQFLRYLPLLRERGANAGRVVCELPRLLHALASRCAGIDLLVAPDDPLPVIDKQIAIMSLPYRLGTIAAPSPYLHADPELVASWGRDLAQIDGFRIGVAWQGDPTFLCDPVRSPPLAAFEPLASVPGVRLICLQKREGRDQIAANTSRVPLLDLDDRLDEANGSFVDTAAIMMNLDLVVTSDSAVAHLAGGLGVPVFMAIHHAAEWRWFSDREDCPWYPSMRIFRQTRLGRWDEVFSRIAEAVASRLRNGC